MKHQLLLSFVVLPLSVCLGQALKPSKIVEIIPCHLSNSSLTDTIRLTAPADFSDPGLFTEITIKIPGKNIQSFKATDSWDVVDSEFLMNNHNPVPSRNVFIYKAPKCTFILLFGFIYGSGREEFSIIKVQNDSAIMISDNSIEEPIQIGHIYAQNEIQLLGRDFGEAIGEVDSLNAFIETYHPYYIYSLENNFQIDSVLTERYNKEHYVWVV